MELSRLGGQGPVQGQEKTTGALNKTSRALQKILEQLSTGQRINRAGDDAAGLGISEQLRTQFRGFKMAQRNVADAMSALNTADSAANEMGDMLQRQRELSIQARNSTLTDDQRKALDVEFQQLKEEIGRTAEATRFNTQQVTTGEDLASGQAVIQAGANAGEELNLPRIDMRPEALGIADKSIDTAESAGAAMAALDNAMNALNVQRSAIGATTNRLGSAVNTLSMAEINTLAAESVLRDQDMAEGLAELLRQRLLQEGGTRAFARFNQISLNHLMGLLG